MKNMKAVCYCWTCGKGHENVPYNHDARDKSYKCDCGGYVQSPSGKVQMAIMPVVPVWKVDDGENHWIAAKDKDEVRGFYSTLYDDPLEDGAEIELVDNETLEKRFIRTDEVPSRLISLKDAVREQDTFPALLACSVW